MDETIDWRSDAINFYYTLQRNNNFVSSQNLYKMHVEGTNHYKIIRERYWSIIKRVQYISEYQPENVRIGTIQKTGPYLHQFNFINALSRNEFFDEYFSSNQEVFYINPTTEEGKQVISALKMGLASAFILYDNYAIVIQQFYNVGKLRRLLNYDNAENQGYLDEITKSYTSVQNYRSMVRGFNVYNKVLQYEVLHQESRTPETNYLDQNIHQSYIYSLRDKIGLASIYRLKWNMLIKRIKDYLSISSKDSMYDVSKFFGNSIGLVATRKGKLASLPTEKFKALVEALIQILKPMDLLLEKTPFRLTDKFIPGYWGHVAVWLGTEDQLREEGLWDNLTEKLKMQVRSGNYVLEALREGVVTNRLEHFLNIDSLAILKPNFIDSEEDVEYYLKRSSLQLGKAYDFNFDIESDKTIVCSELAYTIFNKPGIIWPTEKALGRYTISPDNIALKATTSMVARTKYSFSPVVLFHSGRSLTNGSIQLNFDNLLKANYDDLVWE